MDRWVMSRKGPVTVYESAGRRWRTQWMTQLKGRAAGLTCLAAEESEYFAVVKLCMNGIAK
jgi:hypothetical protein